MEGGRPSVMGVDLKATVFFGDKHAGKRLARAALRACAGVHFSGQSRLERGEEYADLARERAAGRHRSSEPPSFLKVARDSRAASLTYPF